MSSASPIPSPSSSPAGSFTTAPPTTSSPRCAARGCASTTPFPAPLPEGIDVYGAERSGRAWTLVLRDGAGGAIERLRALPGVEVLGVDPLSLEEIFKHMARAPSGRNDERSVAAAFFVVGSALSVRRLE